MKAKNVLVSILIVTTVFVTGCTTKNNNENAVQDSDNSGQVTESQSVEPKQVGDLMQQIQAESGVMTINTSRDNDTLVVDITLNSGTDIANAKSLAEKYIKEIEATFKANKANINIIQEGKNIASVKSE